MFALIASLFSRRTPAATEKAKLDAFARILAQKYPGMAPHFRRKNLARYGLLLKLAEQNKTFTIKQVAEAFELSRGRADQVVNKYYRLGVVRRVRYSKWALTDIK